jgi:hypothetical protein
LIAHPGIPLPTLIKAVRLVEKKKREEAIRVARFGKVLPISATQAFGKTLVGIGGMVFESPNTKYVPDFLRRFVPFTLGEDWIKSESEKPDDERHPLIRLGIAGIQYAMAQPVGPDGTRSFKPNGAYTAYMTFAYDLCVVAQNKRLDDAFLARLRDNEHFQGARHELFAEASCLRAGFTIEPEDERDRTKRHAEFTATHKETGVKISVEAKSKGRAGILGQKGIARQRGEVRLQIGALITKAIRKNPPYPLVIFLDTNLPPKEAAYYLNGHPTNPAQPHDSLTKILDEVRKANGSKEGFSLLVLSNQPHHYVKPGEPYPLSHVYSTGPSGDLDLQVLPMEILRGIHERGLHLRKHSARVP